jgi:enamine deaminase RidA (YjgF/YER057c/UK114 family)
MYLVSADDWEAVGRAHGRVFRDVRPAATMTVVVGLLDPRWRVEIEAEAVIGAARARRDIYTQHQREKPRGYARAVAVGEQVYLSGCTSVSSTGEVQAAGDWARQYDLAMDTIGWALGQAGASLDDVVRRRTFTVDRAEVNRPAGQGPAWYERSRPASLGCRVTGLASRDLLVEVEVAAVRGAGAGIEAVGPDAVDPLDAGPRR